MADHSEPKNAENYLQGLVERLSSVPVDPVVLSGSAAETIFAEITRTKIDRSVMSTLGRSGVGWWIYGSAAEKRDAPLPYPVLLVSNASLPTTRPPDRAFRILIPLDFSLLSEAVLAPATRLAKASDAELVLLSVTPVLITVGEYGAELNVRRVQPDSQPGDHRCVFRNASGNPPSNSVRFQGCRPYWS